MIMPRDVPTTRSAAAAAEAAGLEWFGIGDSPVVFGESYLHQAEAVHATERIAVGPLVTHVVLRHPVVLASLLSTLQEISGGRARGVIGTGNSAARGVGLSPARLAEVREAVALIRDHWAGRGATYGESAIPATGVARPEAPLFIAGDGPKVAALGAEVGDGFMFSGALDERLVASRAHVLGDVPLWIAVAFSPETSAHAVHADLGAALVAIANRALRGDLSERRVPDALQPQVRAMHQAYDYAHHGTHERPSNAEVISDELAEFLAERFCIWGDDARFAQTLAMLEGAGCAGVMFIVNRPDPVGTIEELGRRLRR
jgi:alkanesulfonate monooxygenase SsuD/methylene tetrahydromethanopterin reductase-like flavin-dependent oxidoreductase (luciferase family)